MLRQPGQAYVKEKMPQIAWYTVLSLVSQSCQKYWFTTDSDSENNKTLFILSPHITKITWIQS